MIDIEYLNIEIPVYDINVEHNHNFYANDILVHNCVESYSNFKPSTVEKTTLEKTDKGYEITRKTSAGTVHTCLTGDTLIDVKIDEIISTQTLEHIISLLTNGNKIYVKSYNHENNEVEFALIEYGQLMKQDASLLRITTDSGKIIECTEDHLIWTENRGYIEAKNLTEHDILKSL